MQGKRGVVIVQLWNGFDRERGQPLYDPWVVHLLEAALRTPGVRAVPSVAPGGVGLTAVLFADKEPWSAWGPHLASFGCQVGGVRWGVPYIRTESGEEPDVEAGWERMVYLIRLDTGTSERKRGVARGVPGYKV